MYLQCSSGAFMGGGLHDITCKCGSSQLLSIAVNKLLSPFLRFMEDDEASSLYMVRLCSHLAAGVVLCVATDALRGLGGAGTV